MLWKPLKTSIPSRIEAINPQVVKENLRHHIFFALLIRVTEKGPSARE